MIRKLLLSLKGILPYSWWIVLLSILACLRTRVVKGQGDAYFWLWDQDDQTFGQEQCRRLLADELLPAFERAVGHDPQPYGMSHFLALIAINSPEGQPLKRDPFRFHLFDIELAKETVTNSLLAQVPLELRRRSQIGFVISNIADLTLVPFTYKRLAILRSIKASGQKLN